MNSEKIVNLNLLKKYGMIHKIGHPASDNNNKSSLTYLSEADIIISDYSSIGLESIILNIPTILIDDNYWDNQVKNIDLVCENARNATIRVTNIDELIIAIVKYKSDPKYLENERIKYGKQLSTFHFNASEIFVNELYKIYSSNHF